MKKESTLAKMISTAGERAAYDNACKKMIEEMENEVNEMCNLSKGIEEIGIQKGIQRGQQEGILNSLRNLMETMNLAMETAMDALKIPEKDRAIYAEYLKKNK